MIKIHSKIDAEKILHVILRKDEGNSGKMNHFVSEQETLQVAAGKDILKGHNFGGPHKHLAQERKTDKTDEVIVVIRGKIKLDMYDLDDKLLGSEELGAGDCYIYLGGGHCYEIIEPETYFYEIKNGPYFGPERDRQKVN